MKMLEVGRRRENIHASLAVNTDRINQFGWEGKKPESELNERG